MTPEDRTHATALANEAFQLCLALDEATLCSEAARMEVIREEMHRVAADLVPYLVQVRDEQAQWRKRA